MYPSSLCFIHYILEKIVFYVLVLRMRNCPVHFTLVLLFKCCLLLASPRPSPPTRVPGTLENRFQYSIPPFLVKSSFLFR